MLAPRPDEVYSSDESTELTQHRKIIEFWRMAAESWVECEAKSAESLQGLFLDFERRDDGYFCIRKFAGEFMFFEDGRIAPAVWPVELGDNR